MKRTIALIVILAFATYAFALESDPSETVGFIRIDMPSPSYTAFSLPFTFYDSGGFPSMDINDVIGNQLSGTNPGDADEIICINDGTSAFYAGAWFGSLTTFDFKYGYWTKKNALNPSDSLYLAGEVDREVIDYGTLLPGYTCAGIKEAGVVNIDDVDLDECGFTGTNPLDADEIICINDGTSAFYAEGWFGSLTHIYPGYVYWIKVNDAHPAGFHWIYDPLSKSTKVGSKVKIIKVTKPVYYK